MVGRTNDGVAFPMTNLQGLVNVRLALAQRSAVGDLFASIPTTGVELSLLLLTTQILPQRAATGLVRVNIQVKRFMAHWQLAGDLPGIPLQPQKLASLTFTQGASVQALRLDSERLQASSQACLAL